MNEHDFSHKAPSANAQNDAAPPWPERARVSREFLQRAVKNGLWTDECEMACHTLVEALTEGRMSKEMIVSELKDVGLSKEGACQTVGLPLQQSSGVLYGCLYGCLRHLVLHLGLYVLGIVLSVIYLAAVVISNGVGHVVTLVMPECSPWVRDNEGVMRLGVGVLLGAAAIFWLIRLRRKQKTLPKITE